MPAQHSDKLGRLRYVPLAISPIGIAAFFIMLDGARTDDRAQLWGGGAALMVWGIALVLLGVTIRRRLRSSSETREET